MLTSLNSAADLVGPRSCIFPTTKRRGKTVSPFDHVNVDTSTQPHLLARSLHDVPSELCKAAWAKLLSTYARTDTVSFAVHSSSQQTDESRNTAQSESLIMSNNVSICQYRLCKDAHLDTVHEIRCTTTSLKGLENEACNTAIYFLDLDCSYLDEGTTGPQLDLILKVGLKASEPPLSLAYRNDTISYPYALSIAKSFRSILDNLSTNSRANEGPCKAISGEDQHRLVSWNPSPLYTHMNCMHHLVEAAVRCAPHAEAICAWDGSATYAQLDSLSSAAARLLGKLGVGPGTFVPFAFEKSMWTVVATLAILKAGAAFVPLEPNHPDSRLREILSATRAKIVVCSEMYASKFMELGNRVVVISARTVHANKSNTGIHNLYSTPVRPSDPIFVLFTSGSTGKPKGMVHEHGAICTHAITHGEVMGYHGARVLQFAAHTFDVAIMDMYTTLIFGGCICIPSEAERKSNIIAAINNMRADYAILTPSFARLLKPSDVPTIRTLAVGGEALPQDGLEQWLEKTSLIQIYGPAEVGICLSIEMQINQTRGETVGFPLPNCSCWLVDPNDSDVLVPIGAVGEMVVAGPSLARCYLNDEAKTKELFLNNPAWAKQLGLSETRFYKTGDLLRYNTDSFDGSFDFIGRKDKQIKLRGQRIEPAEIEHHMASLSGVAVSMVTFPDRGCFKGQLVVVLEMHSEVSSHVRNEPLSLVTDPSITLEKVRQHCSQFLPGYMVPTVCLVIKSMPFVPSLKIDRKIVDAWLNNMEGAPDGVAHDSMGELRSTPLTSTESTAILLSMKIAELLTASEIHPRTDLQNQDFILQATGIDSIQIISLSLHLQRTYDLKIPMETLLSSTLTIRDLAVLVDYRNHGLVDVEKHLRVDILQELDNYSGRLFITLENRTIVDNNTGTKPRSRNVFLTGASGFLGSSILRHLMSENDGQVFTLVRCSDESQGLRRLVESCHSKTWWKEEYTSRIHVWKGDLAQEDLGLSSLQQSHLLGTSREENNHIHAIIHNGAKVHYLSSFSSLARTNIESTSTLLRFTALAPQITSFIFVSGGLQPDDDFTPNAIAGSRKEELDLADGYAKTKLTSELLVARCAEHDALNGTQLTTVKPGYIMGSVDDGVANQSDFIWRFIAGCVEIGAYDEDALNQWLFIADVDHVADAVVSPLVTSSFGNIDSAVNVTRVLDGLTFAELWRLLEGEFGYKLKGVTHKDWMSRMRARVLEEGDNHLLFPLMHVLERDGAEIGTLKKPEGMTRESGERVRAAVKSNVRYLIGAGFFPEVEAKVDA